MLTSKAVPVADLTLPESGWRPTGDIRALSKAMAKDGQQMPIVIDPFGLVLAGQRRLTANPESTILAVVVTTIWELFEELIRQNAENARWFSALTVAPTPFEMMVMSQAWYEWDSVAAALRRRERSVKARATRAAMMPGTTPGPRTRRGRSLLYEGFAASLGVNESQFNRMWMMWRSGHTHPLVPVREDALRRLAELTDMRGVATAHGAWRAVKEAAERAAQAAPSPERTKLHAFTAQLRGSFGGLGDPHQFGVSLSPFERRAAAIELGRYKDTLATLITHLRKDPTP